MLIAVLDTFQILLEPIIQQGKNENTWELVVTGDSMHEVDVALSVF